MREMRLFVEAPLQTGVELRLPARVARHALKVLRLKIGDGVMLFNGDGNDYPARIAAVGAGEASVAVEAREATTRESPLRITLLQALARGEKMDWIVQKTTELGVARIVPVATERSEVKLDPVRREKRLRHWRAVAIAACEQCGRNVLPAIESPVPLAAWLASHAADLPVPRWMLSPRGALGPRDLKLPPDTVFIVAVGPEGGFGEADLRSLREHRFKALALGPRVLRTETAGITALAALQALYGDL